MTTPANGRTTAGLSRRAVTVLASLSAHSGLSQYDALNRLLYGLTLFDAEFVAGILLLGSLAEFQFRIEDTTGEAITVVMTIDKDSHLPVITPTLRKLAEVK